MYIPWGGTCTLPKGCTIVSWLFLSCLHLPSIPWLATVWTCPLELRKGHGGCMKPISYKQEVGDTEQLLCPGAPQGPAQFQWCIVHQTYPSLFHLLAFAWKALSTRIPLSFILTYQRFTCSIRPSSKDSSCRTSFMNLPNPPPFSYCTYHMLPSILAICTHCLIFLFYWGIVYIP